MITQADAGGQPRTVMVHLEDTAAACAAVVGSVGLQGMAFLTEPHFAVRFNSKASHFGVCLCWQG